ncbi:MAG: T9SS type A sorting domain-containing protein [Bacteroidota bacterium]|jgi:photosystem II stability/assembly factor-like uncharacterized protein
MKKVPVLFVLFLLTFRGEAQWGQTNGLTGQSVFSFAASGSNILAGSDSGIYLSTNGGLGWIRIKKTNSPAISFAVRGSLIFVGTAGSGVLSSSDTGKTWHGDSLDHSTVYSFGMHDSTILKGTDNGALRSVDSGKTWQSALLGGLSVKCLIADSAGIIAGTSTGGLFRTSDDGESWHAIDNGLMTNFISSFAVIQSSIFAGTDNGIFRSTDHGLNWQLADSGLTDNRVQCFSVISVNFFAGTVGGGVFLSTDAGTHWQAVNDGLDSLDIRALAVTDSNILAGTFGGGVWRRPRAGFITSVREDRPGQTPRSYALLQNYPNPFNPTTVIDYQLPSDEYVTLRVYNALGQEVRTLVNGVVQAGPHSTVFDGENLASGVYFYRLTAGRFTSVMRFLLVK